MTAILTSHQLHHPAPGDGAGASTTITIAATSTLTIDTALSCRSVKWVVSIISAVPATARFFEVHAVRLYSGDASYIITSDIGDRIPVVINVTAGATSLVLSVTNGTSYPIEITILRIAL